MRLRSGSTLTIALIAALVACRSAQPRTAAGRDPAPAAAAEEDGPAGPTALRASAGAGAEVELSWQPSPTRGVVYAIVDAKGKRVGLTARTHFKVAGFGARGPRCYSVIALDASDRASRPTPAVCVEPTAPGPGEGQPPGGDTDEPPEPDDQSSRPHATPMTTSGALES